MEGQKTLSYSYNMQLCLPYLLNDSLKIGSMINSSKTPLCVTLICGDCSIGLIFISSCLIKQRFVSIVLLCVQRYRGNSNFNAPKQHLVAKNEFQFSFRPTRKSTDGFTQQTHRAINVNRYMGSPTIRVSLWETLAVFSKMTVTQHKVGAILL